MSEFQRKRGEIFALQARLGQEQSTLDQIKNHLEKIRAKLEQQEEVLGEVRKRLERKQWEMQMLTGVFPTVQVFADMSCQGTRVTFGGLILEGGDLIPIHGDLEPSQFSTHSSYNEARALVKATVWAARQWPEALLMVFSDCKGVISALEECIRTGKRNYPFGEYRHQVQELFFHHLGDHFHRLHPRWAPRESPEIAFCDALARQQWGCPAYVTKLRLLSLVQGEVQEKWTPPAEVVLHHAHRATRKGWRLQEHGFTHHPPRV